MLAGDRIPTRLMMPSSLPGRAHRPLFRKVLLLTVAALLAWALYVAGQIYAFAQNDETTAADVAVVLGAATRHERPSPVFRERIDHAVDLYHRGLVQAIILTGGVGDGRQVADSEIAMQYVLENGVPESAVYIETESQDTRQNLEQAQHIMDQQSFATALVVSDPLHMYRAMQMAADLGIDALPSPTPNSRINSIWWQALFLARETYLTMQYSLLG